MDGCSSRLFRGSREILTASHVAVCRHTNMNPRELFEANLAVIERAIARVCADGSLRGADAEDFASEVRVQLLEDDGRILRKWEGRSSFATYITIVIRRLLIDRRRADGRWYPSTAAQRQGAAAVLLERILHRDRTPLDEALALAQRAHPELSAVELYALAAALPERAPRLRVVPIIEGDDDRLAADTTADSRALDYDLGRRSQHASRVVREAMSALTAEDRLILRFRYVKELSIADIARVLGIPQRPLYRRLELLLGALRRSLEQAGLDAASAADLIGAASDRLDFALAGKNDEPHPSLVSAEGEGSGSHP
jgi:RNA polymerase sigma factor (sigma-70 family)